MTSDLAANGALSVGFDYSALSEDDALHGRAAASRIKRRNHKMVEAIIENGQDLLAMKLRIPHGQFEAWIDAECGVSERTARNYMAAARAFGGKTAIVADLSPTTIYALTSADNVRSDVIEKRESGQRLDEQAIGDMLWQARIDGKRVKAEAKLSPEQRQRRKARAERDQRERERSRQERDEGERRRKAALDEAVGLIVARMPDDAPRLVALLDTAWQTEMSRALKGALGL